MVLISLNIITTHSNFILGSYWSTFTSEFHGLPDTENSQCLEAVTSFPPNTVNYSTELSKKKSLLDADGVTTSRSRKLQNSKNGRQQFGKLIARVFLPHIFSCIYHCFECIINNYWVRLTHNIENYPDFGQCFRPQPSASSDKIYLGPDIS